MYRANGVQTDRQTDRQTESIVEELQKLFVNHGPRELSH